MTKRNNTRKLSLGGLEIGGNSPVVVQSMTNTNTADVKATITQIKALTKAGCELVRVAVPDGKAAASISKIKKGIEIPLVADIHFDYRLALEVMDQGVDGLRLNPGNIGDAKKIREVARIARIGKIPIRVGVNSGSLDKELLAEYGGVTAEAMVKSALKEIQTLEDAGHDLIKISLKSSDVRETIAANMLMAEQTDYPLHLGVTEAGTLISGTIKSTFALGSLLSAGIGDTIRVSLTADPVKEIKVAYEILRAAGLRNRGPEIISCPTCGRCEIDLFSLVADVEERLTDIETPIKIAIMGCVVNGPGEAKAADLGLAGGRGQGILFREGKLLAKVKEKDLVGALMSEIEKILKIKSNK